MMYLSSLLIDVGDNPDRPRPGRLWLTKNIYHVHQRLWMAFPTPAQREHDPPFLQPFDPAGFAKAPFLFRIDWALKERDSDSVFPGPIRRAMVLVQSQLEPDWAYAFQNARMILAAAPEVREYNPAFAAGERCRFRVRMNLSKKSAEHRRPSGGTDTQGRQKSQGKRVALTWNGDEGETPETAIREWFSAKGERNGFALRDVEVVHLGWVSANKPKQKDAQNGPAGEGCKEDTEDKDAFRRMKFRSALLEGRLTVTDPDAFGNAIASGIGSAKAFGFGLLSVIPERGSAG